MNSIEVAGLSKAFGATQALSDLSFVVRRGEIFGLLGPNGAGKTTTIRLILDIFRPDRGSIAVLGGPLTDAVKDRIGYMPEERGLYQDVALEQCLTYLARLKGMPAAVARTRLTGLLERFELGPQRGKKVKELSKGMQQKAQIIATILHQPELVIIDEPFTSLDPINTQSVKDLILELAQGGSTILMSTHQMHQVEQLCDRILLIDRGHNLLYGELREIRRRFAGEAVLVGTTETIPPLPGVRSISHANGSLHKLALEPGVAPQDVLRELVERAIELERFEVALPTLDEIFIRAVKQQADM